MIKNKDLAFINGQMGENIKDFGRMGNSTEKENIFQNRENGKQVNGMMVKELDGFNNLIYKCLFYINSNTNVSTLIFKI